MKPRVWFALVALAWGVTASAEGPFRNRDNPDPRDEGEGTYPIPYHLPRPEEIVSVLQRIHAHLDRAMETKVIHARTREEITDGRHIIPAVQFAVDAYINFARQRPWQESVCSSLTELFAPEIHKQRLATWPEHYPWIEPEGLSYFRNRVSQARRDVEQGLAITLDHFNTRPLQERALDILQFKLDILWAMNDAMALKYGVTP